MAMSCFGTFADGYPPNSEYSWDCNVRISEAVDTITQRLLANV